MSEKSSDKDILLLHENLWESVISDLMTMGSLSCVTLLAWWLDSTFLAVFGACLWLIGVMARVHNIAEKRRKTPQEAADYLKREYGVTAKE
jgi:phage gp46-like protein